MVMNGMQKFDVAIYFSVAKSTASAIMKKLRDRNGQVKKIYDQNSS